MLILVPTPAGYSLWRVSNEKALKCDDLCAKYPTPDDAASILTLQDMRLFESTEQAVNALASLANSEVDETLANFLQENIVNQHIHETLQLADAGLARSIENLGIKCVAPAGKDIPEIFRLIRANFLELVPGIDENTMRALELGISHDIATKTLKFSPAKVDSMIVNSVNLLEELDKEINNYGMRVREWYGWHFPELFRVVTDNFLYAKLVLAMGRRNGALTEDLSNLLTPPQIDELQKHAQKSLGTEISNDDLHCIQCLAQQVIELIEFRNEISEYIQQRMKAIAPNLSELVGASIGARLIAHAGSLCQLAKCAASTIQVMGAEKALFKALKDGKKTPKYGIIYHAQLVAHTDQKFKGAVSRSTAARAALSGRIDYFQEESTDKFGVEDRERLENRVRQLEGQQVTFGVARSAIKEAPARIVVEQPPNYKVEEDFKLDEEQPKKKRRKHRHHKEEAAQE